MNLYTIGFTEKTAEEFFEQLKKNRIKRIIDIRLNNNSQLAGFTKQRDLEYFLKAISNIEYIYMPVFAPTKELLDSYRKKKTNWQEYENAYLNLLKHREVLKDINFSLFIDACLLCSEASANKCHRRLLAEYLSENNEEIKVIHI